MSVSQQLADTITMHSTRDGITEAILDEFVVIPRSELPAVIVSGSGFDVNNVWFPEGNDAEHFERLALRMLALAAHLGQDEAAIEARRNTRRDQLAVELAEGLKSHGEHRVYSGLSTVAKRAIDMIIELEQKS